MRIRFTRAFAGAMALAVSAFSSAHAGTLDDIISSGKIKIGVYVDAPPMGFTDSAGNPTGSDVEVAKLLAKDLKVELELVPVTAPNRIPFLVTKKVDIVMASLVPSPERAKTVAFSNAYGSLPISLFARKDKAIAAPADLVGKRISVVRASIAAQVIKTIAPKGAEVIEYEDNATTITSFVSGQTDVMVAADSTGETVAKQNPAQQFEIKFGVKDVYYSIGLRRGDHDFRQWLNVFIFTHADDGELNAIYKKYFGHDMKTFPVF